MAMVVRSNLTALNANRQLGVNNSQVAKSLEKLSSGYRINRAGDDASGLAISEKMKAQIKGLEQASSNAQDGISLVQTAEGAMTEVHNMLNRMTELATKSSNGTIQDEVDRENIQNEVNELISEIDRIGDSTNFNGINLLDGSMGGAVSKTATISGYKIDGLAAGVKGIKITYAAGATTAQTASAAKPDADGIINITVSNSGTTLTNTDLQAALVAGGQSDATVSGTGTKVTADVVKVDSKIIEKTAGSIAGTRGNGFSINFAKGKTGITSIQIQGAASTGALGTVNTNGAVVMTLDNTKSYNASDINKMLKDAGVDGIKVDFKGAKSGADVVTGLGLGTAQNVTDGAGSLASGLSLQVGDTNDSFNKVSVSIDDVRSSGLGINGLSVANEVDAGAAIDTIKTAINTVSSNRGTLGALQNRLEYAINNLDVTAENMTSANSRIRDTDMAKEMMSYTKMNVLTQSAQAMLAQANQAPQSILQLLQ